MWLISQDLWHVIEPDNDADDKVSFSKKADSRALANIVLTLSEDQIVHVEDAKTALEAWNNLALVHDTVDTAKTTMLFRQLFTTHLSPTGSAQEYIGTIKSTLLKLARHGHEVPDAIAVAIIIIGLPTRYSNLVTVARRRQKRICCKKDYCLLRPRGLPFYV